MQCKLPLVHAEKVNRGLFWSKSDHPTEFLEYRNDTLILTTLESSRSRYGTQYISDIYNNATQREIANVEERNLMRKKYLIPLSHRKSISNSYAVGDWPYKMYYNQMFAVLIVNSWLKPKVDKPKFFSDLIK